MTICTAHSLKFIKKKKPTIININSFSKPLDKTLNGLAPAYGSSHGESLLHQD